MILVSRPQAQYAAHAQAIDAAMKRVLSGGRYILGPEVAAFEAAFAAWCGMPHAVGVANGTDAITVALAALDIGPGDEVITVAHTAVATIAGIVRSGATPVMVDIDPDSWTIDPAAAAAAVGPRSRAILPVHLYGHPADMDAIAALAHRHGLAVIEDCAQAHGAAYRGRRVGTFGEAATFSFYPTKNLGAIGDGGAVLFRDPDRAARARAIREYGWDSHRVSRLPGFNSRLDELQAAVLAAKLPHLDADNRRRTAVAVRYSAAFAGLPVRRPAPPPDVASAWHLYVIACRDRDALRDHLERHGIAAGIHYSPPAHRHPSWAPPQALDLPCTDRAAAEVLSLPIYPELSPADVETVIAAVLSFFSQGNKS